MESRGQEDEGEATAPTHALGFRELASEWDGLSAAWVGTPIPDGWSPGRAALPLLVLEIPTMPGRRRHGEAASPLRAEVLVLRARYVYEEAVPWWVGWLGRNVAARRVDVEEWGGGPADDMAAAVGGTRHCDLELAGLGYDLSGYKVLERACTGRERAMVAGLH